MRDVSKDESKGARLALALILRSCAERAASRRMAADANWPATETLVPAIEGVFPSQQRRGRRIGATRQFCMRPTA